MELDRRTMLKGLAALAAVVPFSTTAVEGFEEFPCFPAATSPWHASWWLPESRLRMQRQAEPFILESAWHYESLDEGWGVNRQLRSGLAFVTLPSNYTTTLTKIPVRQAYPLIGRGDTKEAGRQRYAMSSAAAQVATWAEEAGGGALFLSFPHREQVGPARFFMKSEPAPPLIAFDGSRSVDRDFELYS